MKEIDRKTKNVILTGAGGFLGGYLLKELLKVSRCKVVAITTKDLDAKIRGSLVTVSSHDWGTIEAVLSDADVLINSAFPRHVEGKAVADGLSFIDRVFRLAGKNEGCSVVNISSQSVYSQRDPKPATEDDALCLESSYAVAKYATELLLDAHCQKSKHTNIRLASLIGPGFDQRVINKMIARAMCGEALTVFENGSRFGYLDVRDAAEAITALSTTVSDSDWDCSYNIGSTTAYSLTEIAKSVQEVCGRRYDDKVELSVEITEHPAVYSLINSSRFAALTGWHARYDLEETITAIEAELKSRNSC